MTGSPKCTWEGFLCVRSVDRSLFKDVGLATQAELIGKKYHCDHCHCQVTRNQFSGERVTLKMFSSAKPKAMNT